jgi:penicillin-binding protein 1A
MSRPLFARPASATRPPGELRAAALVRARRAAHRARRRRRRLIVGWLLAAILVGAGTFSGGLLAAPVDFAAPPAPKSAKLLDSSGHVFATIRSPRDRQPVAAGRIPAVMRKAIVAAEDERFYAHSGVDPLATFRALGRDLTGSPLQGGSTITQQYVKQVYTTKQRTVLRKIQEAALAFRLDNHLSKRQILTRYLNSLYLGNGAYGVQAASKYYFGVPINHLARDTRTGRSNTSLALARAALLAGMAPAPSDWNPIADHGAARHRQLYTLNRMVANGMISTAQASAAYQTPLHISPHSQPDLPTIAPEFRDLVTGKLKARYSDDVIFLSGLQVRTTLDLPLQKAVVAALHDVLPKASDPEAAIVAVDPRDGDLRALATKSKGGYQKGGFDLATQAVRSTGSTIKPFTLAAAIEAGRSPDDSVYAPSVATVPNPGGKPNPYPIHNAGGQGESGTYTLRTALWHSVNTVYGPLALKVGLRNVFDLAQAAGMAPPHDFKTLEPAKSLGVEVTPISEARAYATLVDHGVRHQVRSLAAVRTGGRQLYDAPAHPNGHRAMPAHIADTVADVLTGVVEHGTASGEVNEPFPVYGKTGTTDRYEDAWFTGCTRTLCITTWMGYNKNRPMEDVEGVSRVEGGTLPAKVFAQTWDNLRTLRSGGSLDVAPGSDGSDSGRGADG